MRVAGSSRVSLVGGAKQAGSLRAAGLITEYVSQSYRLFWVRVFHSSPQAAQASVCGSSVHEVTLTVSYSNVILRMVTPDLTLVRTYLLWLGSGP